METGPDLSWEVRPWAEHPPRAFLALAVILAAAAASWAVAGPGFGLLAAGLLGGGAAPFFVTTRYRLTARGVEVRSPVLRVNRPWSDFRRAYVEGASVTLSPFRSRHVLEPYRSVVLRYGGLREEILRCVRAHLPEAGAA